MKSLTSSTLALCTGAALFMSATSSSAEEIKVFAGEGVMWSAADCDRCEQQGNNVKISVEPEDVIIFFQQATNPLEKHGVFAGPTELSKIAVRGENDSESKIAIESAPPSMFGDADSQQITPGQPIEITRLKIKDNFSGQLIIWCNVHFGMMQVILERN